MTVLADRRNNRTAWTLPHAFRILGTRCRRVGRVSGRGASSASLGAAQILERRPNSPPRQTRWGSLVDPPGNNQWSLETYSPGGFEETNSGSQNEPSCEFVNFLLADLKAREGSVALAPGISEKCLKGLKLPPARFCSRLQVKQKCACGPAALPSTSL